MKRDVLISITGTQSNENGSDSVEFITEGLFYKKKDNYYIVYHESEVTGLSGTSMLKVEKDRVTMTRTGENSSHMIFEQGKRFLSHYDTGYGVFNIEVSTDSVGIHIDDDGGEVKVEYSLEINNEYEGQNTFHIKVREAAKEHDKSCTVS